MFVDLDWPLNASRRLSASACYRASAYDARRAAIRLSVCIAYVARRYYVHMVARVIKVFRDLYRYIILVFWAEIPTITTSTRDRLNTGGVHNLRLSTNIAGYLGNGIQDIDPFTIDQ